MLDDEAKAVGAADAESGEKGKEESGTKVVVLINENSPVLSPLLFLRKKGYKIKIAHKLSDGGTYETGRYLVLRLSIAAC